MTLDHAYRRRPNRLCRCRAESARTRDQRRRSRCGRIPGLRGLSTRDVEATLEEALGEQAALSKSTVSPICSILVEQFGVWQRRDLSDYELDYLFADASFFKYHAAAKGEPVLCTHGITTDGKRVFLGLSAGVAESFDSWHAHFIDLRDRNLRAPLLGISDGSTALISAFEQVFTQSLRQRCTVHYAEVWIMPMSPGLGIQLVA